MSEVLFIEKLENSNVRDSLVFRVFESIASKDKDETTLNERQ